MMTREASWNVACPTLSVLRQIAAAGYLVSVHRLPSSLLSRVPASVEMHAVKPGNEHQQIASVAADEDNAEYRCACLLAEMVGVDR